MTSGATTSSEDAHLLKYDQQQLRDFLQWDIDTWKHALYHWDAVLANRPPTDGPLKALDLGARDGGLSLYLAQKGFEVVCSDMEGPTELAHRLHERYGLAGQITYQAVNATAIPFEDECFDVVIFKSILGGIGTFLNYAAIETAVGEMRRVLKPGGVLLFAENQRGSRFHQKARSIFVPWGKRWYYVSLEEIEALLAGFASCEIRTYGFLACIKKDFAPFVALDHLICRSPRSAQQYMAYGHAVKG